MNLRPRIREKEIDGTFRFNAVSHGERVADAVAKNKGEYKPTAIEVRHSKEALDKLQKLRRHNPNYCLMATDPSMLKGKSQFFIHDQSVLQRNSVASEKRKREPR